jgi:hypothetical protein
MLRGFSASARRHLSKPFSLVDSLLPVRSNKGRPGTLHHPVTTHGQPSIHTVSLDPVICSVHHGMRFLSLLESVSEETCLLSSCSHQRDQCRTEAAAVFGKTDADALLVLADALDLAESLSNVVLEAWVVFH